MPSSTLEIGGIIVATAEGGPFDVEYALFEAHEIELRANNEPGNVRENGYLTTVDLARERLEANGVTHALAEAVAGEMGALVSSYARGPDVRRVASMLRACELFEGRTWNAVTKQYDGAWLDVASLATDAGVAGGGRALQALHLAALLHDAKGDAKVFLATGEYSAGRMAGARSHRRVSLEAVSEVEEAIRVLAEKRAPRTARDGGPSRAELLQLVRERQALCVDEQARAELEPLERMLSVREPPLKGPLADADLWALEVALADGETAGVLEKLEAIERSRGRAPGTTYLRARLALMLEEEPARVLAERASALALSMSAFAELELLAAEAWTLAGERKRALAHARDLADNPQVDAVIRARARALVVRASALSGERSMTAPPMAAVSVPPAANSETESDPASEGPDTPLVAITTGNRASYVPSRRPSVAVPKTPSIAAAPMPSGAPPRMQSGTLPSSPSASSYRLSSAAPPPTARRASQEFAVDDRPTPIQPVPIVQVRGSIVPMAEALPAPARESVVPARDERRSSVPHQERVSQTPAQATLDSLNPPARLSSPGPVAPIPVPSLAPRPPSPDEDDDEDVESPHAVFIRGGSQPPFRTEPPPEHFPASPLIPQLDNGKVERAEALSLPPGLHGESVTARPTNAMEARIYFTQRSRELGRMYRAASGVELRTDVRSIEVMQRHLAERFASGELRSLEELDEVQAHGAFLSEILARRLGAEWIDLNVSEMGYWAMSVPPSSRVWPIGRVIRYVTMQHRERDLVSYFLELQARRHGLR